MTTVVTGFSPKGHVLYGRQFLETFDALWPRDVDLMCYTEEPTEVPREGLRSLWDCVGAREFIDQYAHDRRANGRMPDHRWKPKDINHGYSYRWDAVKFCRQCFIPEAAAIELPDGEVMVWLDADVVTFKEVPPTLVEDLMGPAELCYLGRAASTHSEIGFWAVRLSPITRSFLAALAGVYRDRRVFEEKEWHSAYVFDLVRTAAPAMRVRNLTPNGNGHVWFQSPLSLYMDHLKGEQRKRMGRSMERRL